MMMDVSTVESPSESSWVFLARNGRITVTYRRPIGSMVVSRTKVANAKLLHSLSLTRRALGWGRGLEDDTRPSPWPSRNYHEAAPSTAARAQYTCVDREGSG